MSRSLRPQTASLSYEAIRTETGSGERRWAENGSEHTLLVRICTLHRFCTKTTTVHVACALDVYGWKQQFNVKNTHIQQQQWQKNERVDPIQQYINSTINHLGRTCASSTTSSTTLPSHHTIVSCLMPQLIIYETLRAHLYTRSHGSASCRRCHTQDSWLLVFDNFPIGSVFL